jgi:hypothetical protein
MNRFNFRMSGALAALLTMAVPVWAESPATAPATTSAANPDAAALRATIEALSADDYAARERASAALHEMLTQQLRSAERLQETMDELTESLAAQMRVLGQTSDPEAKARVAGLLEIQKGLVHFTSETMPLPLAERRRLQEWAFGPKVAPLLGKVYAQDRHKRLDGIKEIAKIDGSAWLMAHLLKQDTDVAARTQVLACLWDQKPAKETLEVLWQMAFPPQQNDSGDSEAQDVEGRAAAAPAPLTISFPELPNEFQFGEEDDSSEDHALAVRVLNHWKSPETTKRLETLLTSLIKEDHLLGPQRDRNWLYSFDHLVLAHKVKAAVPYLALMALSERNDNQESEINNIKYFSSNRTDPLGTLLELVGESPDEYHLHRASVAGDNVGDVWAADTDANEQAATGQFYTWWKAHYKEYGVKRMPAAPVFIPPPGAAGGGGIGQGPARVQWDGPNAPPPAAGAGEAATSTAPATGPAASPTTAPTTGPATRAAPARAD